MSSLKLDDVVLVPGAKEFQDRVRAAQVERDLHIAVYNGKMDDLLREVGYEDFRSVFGYWLGRSWNCPVSLIGCCIYDLIEPNKTCILCGGPQERK